MISGTRDREPRRGGTPGSCAGQARISHRMKATGAVAITV
jgi:hypothetical protein